MTFGRCRGHLLLFFILALLVGCDEYEFPPVDKVTLVVVNDLSREIPLKKLNKVQQVQLTRHYLAIHQEILSRIRKRERTVISLGCENVITGNYNGYNYESLKGLSKERLAEVVTLPALKLAVKFAGELTIVCADKTDQLILNNQFQVESEKFLKQKSSERSLEKGRELLEGMMAIAYNRNDNLLRKIEAHRGSSPIVFLNELNMDDLLRRLRGANWDIETVRVEGSRNYPLYQYSEELRALLKK